MEDVLSTFFQQATTALNHVEIDAVLAYSDIRSLLLEVQLSTLGRVVQEHNDQQRGDASNRFVDMEDVRERLKNLNHDNNDSEQDSSSVTLSKLSGVMNEAARLAFARLVLCSGLLHESSSVTTSEQLQRQASGTLDRKHVLEFCGLVQSTLRLPMVLDHLQQGTPLFPEIVAAAAAGDKSSCRVQQQPHDRLLHIQSLLFQSLGYDPGFAHEEMKRLFLTIHHDATEPNDGPTNNDNDTNPYSPYAHDTEILRAMQEMVSATSLALAKAQQSSHAPSSLLLSDMEQGGVTRVVGVTYSERMVDPTTGQVVESCAESTTAPTMESMQEPATREEDQSQQQEEQQRRHETRVHVATASLQTQLYQELVAMTESERTATLAEAHDVTRRVLQEAASQPGPLERIEFLRSMDPSTQRLMILHNLWNARNKNHNNHKEEDEGS